MSESKSAVLKQSTVWWWVLAGVVITVFFAAIYWYSAGDAIDIANIGEFVSSDFFFYLLVGLGAQLVDGALGMAYGVTSTSFLLSLGVPPAISSASVHVAERSEERRVGKECRSRRWPDDTKDKKSL